MVGENLTPKRKTNGFISYLKSIFGKTKGEIVFNVINYLVFIILFALCLYPFIYVLIKSTKIIDISGDFAVTKFGFDAYAAVFEDENLFDSLLLSIGVTALSTVISLIFTTLGSYPLIKKDLKGRNVILFFIIFAMLFSGGLIPFYLLIDDLNLTNNVLVYIVVGLLSPYNIIIMKNFFASLPQEVFESARVDGASEVRTLFSIALPLSGPIIATIALWTAVGKWNDWMTSMYYMLDCEKSQWMFQYLLQNILNNASSTSGTINPEVVALGENIQSAAIIISILPIVIVYPFVQKYFVKGVLLGSVKG